MNLDYQVDKLNIDKLEKEIQELNSIQTDLLQYIDQQGERLETIEDNISNVDLNVKIGKNNLLEANKYFFKYTPIILGTTLGTLTLGPIGALLNLKLSSALYLGGGIFGGIAGYKLQKL
jgi:hypothetical protein